MVTKWTLPVLCLLGIGLLLLPEFLAPAQREGDPRQSGPSLIDWRMAGMDANADGRVTFEEAQAVRQELTQEEFKARDLNNDGVWTSEDRGSGYRTMTGRRRMEEVDTNSDGKVTLEEYTAACQEEFKNLDSDASGGIILEEWPRRGSFGGPGMIGARSWGPSPEGPGRMEPMPPPFGEPMEGGPPPVGPDGFRPPGPQGGNPMEGAPRVEDASGTQG